MFRVLLKVSIIKGWNPQILNKNILNRTFGPGAYI